MDTKIRTVEDISAEVLAENVNWNYPVSEILRRIIPLGTVSYEGKTLRILDRVVQDGDFYLTGRNIQSGVNGVRLLKAKLVDHKNNWVLAEPFAYAFNIPECVPVEVI